MGDIVPLSFEFSDHEKLIWKAKEKIMVSQWAERHRYVAKGPAQGLWRNEFTPYTVQPMDSFCLPWVRKIYLCWAPQTAKTQVAINCLQYAIDQDPGPAMYIMSNEGTAKRISKRQILPAFRSSPRISALLSDKVDDVSTKLISFKNGMDLMMAWATSAAEMASESIRYLFLDEPGKYPDFAGREADPFSLAEIRTTAYPHTKKILYFSTPNLDGDAFSTALEEDVDVRYDYHARCPFCRTFQKMTFENIHWGDSRDPKHIRRKKLARYSCAHCGMEWNDAFRDDAVRAGKWFSAHDIERPASIAFHLPSWYSPMVSLSDVAADFLKGLKDPKKFQAFVTQHKAEPWKEVVEQKDESAILKLKNDLPEGIVPLWADALTAGIDMQKHGFWFVVRAWDKDLNSHLVQYGNLSTWDDVKSLIFSTRYHVDGSDQTMGIWRAALDTGGGKQDGQDDDDWTRTEEAYQFLRAFSQGKICGIKGSSRRMINRIRKSVIDKYPHKNKKIPGGLELRILDTFQFKTLVHWRLGKRDGEGQLFSQTFSLHSGTGIDYARQILAEELRKDRKGVKSFHQLRKDNHLLDCEVYAAACADPEWAPSLSFLAKNSVQGGMKQTGVEKKQHAGNDHVAGRDRPDWFQRR